MKRTIKIVLLLCLSLIVSALVLTACNITDFLPVLEATTPEETTPPPHVHTVVIDSAVAPTCTETGLTAGAHCSECNEILVDQAIVKALGHTEVVDKAVAPTCAETGLTEGKHCSVCNEIIKAQEFVKPFGHAEVVNKAVTPTCTETGLTEGKHCSVCNEVLVAQKTVKALGHTEVVDKAIAPTCTGTGLTEGKHCSVCDKVLVAQKIVPSTPDIHSYESTVIKKPTTTENGIAKYTCTICSKTYITDLVPANFSVTSSNREMIGYTGVEGESLVIPAVFQNNGKWYRVTYIDYNAFKQCEGLINITIPDSVTGIHAFAFSSCISLMSITIPNSVTKIGGFAFDSCSSLTSIELPDGITSISSGTFSDCSSLKNLVIPDSVKNIDPYAFEGCSSLTNIKIPNSVTSIDYHAFEDCSSLTSITLPNSLTSIDENVFSGCSSLTSITVPNSITSIGEYAFYNCTSLTSITFKGTQAQWQAINKGVNWDRGTNNYTVRCTNDFPAITWQEVDKTVYSITEVRLRQEAAGTSVSLAIIAKETALHCIKQSNLWYYVEYGELKGYVSKASITEINILGTDFVEITGGSKVMYANAQTINVRLYPTDADFSSIVGSFTLNAEVTVVATNGTWYKVKYVKDGAEKEYYVHAACLSDAKIIDPNDDAPYKDQFTPVNGDTGVEKYVKVDQGGRVNFRNAPNFESTIITPLSDGVKVTVLKTGTVNGMEWSYIVVKVESDNAGVPSEYKFGYIISDYLSNTTGDMTLDDLLAHYPTFTKVESGIVYYVLKEATITVRREPVFPTDGEASNTLANPQSGKTPDSIKAIKVVATGTIDGSRWVIVEFVKKDGDTETLIRGFVGGKALEYLTTDANGNPTVSIEDLIAKYPQFTKLETSVNVTARSNANTYGTPDASSVVLGQITAGTTVKLVAEESSAYATWYVVEDAEGKLLFVGKEFFK